MPSTVWRGRIAFGLVSIPVRLHKAARRERIQFRHVYRPAAEARPEEPEEAEAGIADEPEAAPSKPQQARALADEPAEEPAEEPAGVPDQVVRFHHAPPLDAAGAPILKGFEIQKDQYVVLQPSEIKALRPRTSTELSILEFVSLAEIDPVYFDTSYYVAPEKGGEKPYAILFEALRKSGYVALGQVAMHGREHAVVIRAGGRGLILHTLFYANEVRQNEAPAADPALVGKKELELAGMLVQALEAKFEPSKLKDTFEERLRELIDVRAQTATAVDRMEEPPAAAPVIDILEALKKSLEKARKPVKSETVAPPKTGKTRRARG